MRKLLSAIVSLSVIADTAEAQNLKITVQPPTLSGIERAPVPDYAPRPMLRVRTFPAQIVEMWEEAPANGCRSNAFAEVTAPGKQRCFGK